MMLIFLVVLLLLLGRGRSGTSGTTGWSFCWPFSGLSSGGDGCLCGSLKGRERGGGIGKLRVRRGKKPNKGNSSHHTCEGAVVGALEGLW